MRTGFGKGNADPGSEATIAGVNSGYWKVIVLRQMVESEYGC
jgi:hypothetical protein